MASLTFAINRDPAKPARVRTRFARWSRGWARALLALLAAVLVYGAFLGLLPNGESLVQTGASLSGDPSDSDVGLYRAIAGRISRGEDYYAAAVSEHRLRSFPLKPFVTVRLPTLAYIMAQLGETGATLLLDGLVVAALLALARRLRADLPDSMLWMLALTLTGLIPTLLPISAVWHEPWAGVLIVLSLACRTRKRFAGSIMLGLAAVAIRDLALPYLAVMAAMAWWDGTRRETAAWLGAILLAAGMLALHAGLVAAATVPEDLASQGWLRVGGWPFLIAVIRTCGFLSTFPFAVAGIVVPLCLLGWLACDSPLGRRVALLLIGYVFTFTVIGRPENWYWGMLIAPLFFAGLAFVPSALRDLWHAASARPLAGQPLAD